eukprot:jgi/Picre1/34488/NNA_001956.t1
MNTQHQYMGRSLQAGEVSRCSDHGPNLQQPVSLGTTIMAATFEGGVVLGADSRTSTGSYVANRVTNKITALSDRIYPDVLTAATLMQRLAYENKGMLQAGLIVAGWDEKRGGSVYAIPLGGTLVQVPFAIGGSGSAYITGLTDSLWRDDG